MLGTAGSLIPCSQTYAGPRCVRMGAAIGGAVGLASGLLLGSAHNDEIRGRLKGAGIGLGVGLAASFAVRPPHPKLRVGRRGHDQPARCGGRGISQGCSPRSRGRDRGGPGVVASRSLAGASGRRGRRPRRAGGRCARRLDGRSDQRAVWRRSHVGVLGPGAVLMRPTAGLALACHVLVGLTATACVPSHSVSRVSNPDRACPRVQPSVHLAELTWYSPEADGDNRSLEAWCETVGPPVIQSTPARSSGSVTGDSLLVASWNTNGGRATCWLSSMRSSGFPATPRGEPTGEETEAWRPPRTSSCSYRKLCADRAIFRSPDRVLQSTTSTRKCPPHPRLDVVSVAKRCGLALAYNPRGPQRPRAAERSARGQGQRRPVDAPVVRRNGRRTPLRGRSARGRDRQGSGAIGQRRPGSERTSAQHGAALGDPDFRERGAAPRGLRPHRGIGEDGGRRSRRARGVDHRRRRHEHVVDARDGPPASSGVLPGLRPTRSPNRPEARSRRTT